MAVCIRLTRRGRVHLPVWHVGVFDTRQRREGAPIETLGLYDPTNKKEQFRLNVERAKHWLGVGAKPSDTVITLLRKSGLTSDLWLAKKKKATKPKVSTAKKKTEAKKSRDVKKRKKARTTNSKIRAEKKKKPAAS